MYLWITQCRTYCSVKSNQASLQDLLRLKACKSFLFTDELQLFKISLYLLLTQRNVSSLAGIWTWSSRWEADDITMCHRVLYNICILKKCTTNKKTMFFKSFFHFYISLSLLLLSFSLSLPHSPLLFLSFYFFIFLPFSLLTLLFLTYVFNLIFYFSFILSIFVYFVQ